MVIQKLVLVKTLTGSRLARESPSSRRERDSKIYVLGVSDNGFRIERYHHLGHPSKSKLESISSFVPCNFAAIPSSKGKM